MVDQAAEGFLGEFDRVAGMISDNPGACELCRDVALAAKGYRKTLVGSHVAVYAVDEESETVTVIRVFHQTQDYVKLL